jgi:Nickel responsive protein SCO4226-like
MGRDLPAGRQSNHNPAMPKYLIERHLPGAESLSPGALQEISKKSCGVLKEMGPGIQWVQSYVGKDSIYCVYIAPDEESVREHGSRGGFPVTKVTQLVGSIDPTTAEESVLKQ